MADNTIRLTFGYEDTEFTRNYELKIDDSLVAGAKQKIKDINNSLLGGTAGGLSSFFVSDSGENFTLITDAQLTSITETKLDLGGGSNANQP